MRNPTLLEVKFVIVVGLGSGLAACGAFRLHDPGRLSMSTEAVQLASELSTGGQAVFEPMEQNLDAVPNVQAKIAEKFQDYELETIKDRIPNFTAAEVAKELVDAMSDRHETVSRLLQVETQAVQAVNTALDRQQTITKLLKDSIKDKSNLEDTIKRIDKRLRWIQKTLDILVDLQEEAKKSETFSEILANLPEIDPKTAEKFKEAIEKARDAIDQIESDERAKAALKLLRQAGQEIANAEQSRLLEMRRHLGEIKRLGETFTNRDEIAICDVLNPVIPQVHSAVSASETTTITKAIRYLQNRVEPLPANLSAGLTKTTYEQLFAQLKTEKDLKRRKDLERDQKEGEWTDNEEAAVEEALTKFDETLQGMLLKLKTTGRYECLEDYDDDPSRWKNNKALFPDQAWQKTLQYWRKNTLANYVAAELSENKLKYNSPAIVASLGVLLDEKAFLEKIDMEVAREYHRHSILLSKVNAQYRADLIKQLAQGLKLYYQGGIQAEHVAELGLMAAQVGSLVFIGSQL